MVALSSLNRWPKSKYIVSSSLPHTIFGLGQPGQRCLSLGTFRLWSEGVRGPPPPFDSPLVRPLPPCGSFAPFATLFARLASHFGPLHTSQEPPFFRHETSRGFVERRRATRRGRSWRWSCAGQRRGRRCRAPPRAARRARGSSRFLRKAFGWVGLGWGVCGGFGGGGGEVLGVLGGGGVGGWKLGG